MGMQAQTNNNYQSWPTGVRNVTLKHMVYYVIEYGVNQYNWLNNHNYVASNVDYCNLSESLQ